MKTRRNKDREHRRPSVLALALLLVGAWASIATSPAESSVQETGEQVIAADAPVLQFSWQATSDKSPEWVRTDLWWELTSETGTEPRLSAVLTEETEASTSSTPVRGFDSMPATGTVEFAVTNPEETGAVTIAWNLTARVEEDQAELTLAVDAETITNPSSRVSVPEQSRYYNEIDQVATIYTIDATAPTGTSGRGLSITLAPLETVQQSRSVTASAFFDGTWTPFSEDILIPWPVDCGAECETSVDVVMTSAPRFSVDSNDQDGSVTVVASQPQRSEPVRVDLGPAPMLGDEQVFVLDIDLPNTGPLGRQVVFSAITNGASDEDSFCSVPITYVVAGGGLDQPAGYLNEGWEIHTSALLKAGGETIEVRLGPVGNPEECEADRDEPISVSVGVTTYGIATPPQARVTVR